MEMARYKKYYKPRKRLTVLEWLLIFIIGSLIVILLVNPNIFQKSNLESILTPQNLSEQNLSNLNNNSQLEVNTIEVNISDTMSLNRCSVLESLSEQQQVSSSIKKKELCTYYCGNSNYNFYSYNCVKDKFHCYCKL